MSKKGVKAELFIPLRIVRGTEDASFYSFAYDASSTGYSAVFSAGNTSQSPYILSRTGGTKSVKDIITIIDADSATAKVWPLVPAGSSGTTNPPTTEPPTTDPPTTNPPTTNPPGPTGPNYLDVPKTHWAYGDIVKANERKLMVGVEVRPNGDIRFDPEGLLTNAQVAQILFNAYKDDLRLTGNVPVTLADVRSDAWYYDATVWLVQRGLVDVTQVGNELFFYPNQPAPRGFMAEALYRMANAKGIELPKVNPPVSFTDMSDPRYAGWLPAVSALQQAGVIAGFPDGSFGPEKTLSRCQAAALMIRYTDITGLTP
jgi:hypothetical protein